MNRAVFLDRDNTLIHNDGDLGDPAQVRLIQGAASAIASLRGLGYRIIVVSNQGGVARGKYTEKDVEAVHRRVAELVKSNSGATIDKFYYCPYHPEGTAEQYCREHPWRKPAPGMLRQAADDLDLDMAHSWTVGDQMRDIEAGAAAGTRTILLSDAPEPPEPPRGESGIKPDFVARNMIEASRIIAQHRQKIVELMPAFEGPTFSGGARPRASAVESGVGSQESAARETDPEISLVPELPLPPELPPPLELPPPEVAPPPPKSTRPELAVPAEPMPEPAPMVEPPKPAEALSADDGTTRELLQQIVRELKAHRAHLGDFAMSKMFAALFQMLAVGCVLYSFFHVADPVVFTQWMAGAVLSQLLVITLLLVHGLK